MRITATAILSLAVGCSVYAQHETADSGAHRSASHWADKSHELADYLAARADKGFSGVVLVNVDGNTIFHEAYDPLGHSINKSSCFWIASVSKMFTAATAALLQERGKLDLQAPITTYLDDVPADKKSITLHHLLTHTSGLDSTYVAEGIVDRPKATRSILATPLKYPIGTSFLYSGDGYNLAAIIIEVVTGHPFESVVEDEILTPIGLTSTGFWGYPVDEANCNIVPYETDAGISESLSKPNYGFRGTTGMRSNARDLLLWYQALFNDAGIFANLRKLIFTPYIEKAPHVAYGYGWNIVNTTRNTRMLAHSGQDDVITHVSYLYAFPDEGVVLIILSDSAMDVGTRTLIGMREILFTD